MRNMRLWIGLGAVVAVVVLFFVFRPGGDDNEVTTPPPTSPGTIEPTATTGETETEPQVTTVEQPEVARIDVTVRDGRPAGGIVRTEARKNQQVLLIVRSDVSDEVHVHGYDLESAVGPGSPARIQFRADIAGVFEVELHELEIQIAELTVSP